MGLSAEVADNETKGVERVGVRVPPPRLPASPQLSCLRNFTPLRSATYITCVRVYEKQPIFWLHPSLLGDLHEEHRALP